MDEINLFVIKYNSNKKCLFWCTWKKFTNVAGCWILLEGCVYITEISAIRCKKNNWIQHTLAGWLVDWLMFNVSLHQIYGHTGDRQETGAGRQSHTLKDPKLSFSCIQPQTVLHTTRPSINQLVTTCIYVHTNPTRTGEPGTFWSSESRTLLCMSPPHEDYKTYMHTNVID